MATTTNYSWTTPDDTALVKDGAAAIRTLGSSVDTTVKNLNPETTLGDLAYRSSTANVKTRLALGTAGQVLQVNSGANAPEWATPSSGGMDLISTTTLSGSSVTLSSIPATYNHLQLVIRNFRPSANYAYLSLRFNGDTGNNYSAGSFRAVNGMDAVADFASDRLHAASSNNNGASNAISIFNIYDYKNTTTWKMTNLLSLGNDGGTITDGAYSQAMGGYNQTGAISSITFILASGTFTSGTVLLYGVK